MLPHASMHQSMIRKPGFSLGQGTTSGAVVIAKPGRAYPMLGHTLITFLSNLTLNGNIVVIIIIPFYMQGSQGIKNQSILTKVTQIASGRPRTQAQAA